MSSIQISPPTAPVVFPPVRDASTLNFLYNYFSTLLFIGFGYFFYWTNTATRDLLAASFKLNFGSHFETDTQTVHGWCVLLFVVTLVPYYALQPHLKSKARIVMDYCYRRYYLKSVLSPPEIRAFHNAWKVLLVKFFFAPLMVKFLCLHVFGMVNGGVSLFSTPVIMDNLDTFLNAFNQHGFWFAFDVILFADVVFFTLGYLIELPALRNEIVSAEPTLFGWLVCLICYPPFNRMKDHFFGWSSQDFPHFNNPVVHLVLNGAILMLMAIYASASVALNFKASNLTNRGIVTKGPYAIVRHPAYVAKNCAWWIGGFPLLYQAFADVRPSQIFMVLLGLCATSFIYGLRAWTEEKHLLLADNGYAQYCKRVPFRFIPGVF